MLAGTATRAQTPAAAGPAWPEPYEVPDIVVEESGARSGVAAKDQAWIDALRHAWVRLKLDRCQPAGQASHRELLDMVASVIVGEEQTGPHSYRGRLTVHFDPRRVFEISDLAPLQEAPSTEGPPLTSDGMASDGMASDEGEPEITLAPQRIPSSQRPPISGPDTGGLSAPTPAWVGCRSGRGGDIAATPA